MRTDKELLQLLLNYIENVAVCECLSNHLLDLFFDNVISEKERYKVLDILHQNRPNDNSFFFPYGEKQPRIEFLKKLINKY